MRGWFAALLLILTLLPGSAQAQTYRWVDEAGAVYYTQGLESIPERYRPQAQQIAPSPAPAQPSEPAASGASVPPLRAPTAEFQVTIAPDLTPVCSFAADQLQKFVWVRVSWEDEIRRILTKLLTPEARRDIYPHEVTFVVAIFPNPDQAAGYACGRVDSLETTIVLSTKLLRDSSRWQQFELSVARVLAHELAHIALHWYRTTVTLDRVKKELEADELGIYYFARAGYDCRQWPPKSPPYADAATVRAACDLAMQELRPPRRAR